MHIHDLSQTIAEAIQGNSSIRPALIAPDDLETLRKETLGFLKNAAIELADKTDQDIKELHIVLIGVGSSLNFRSGT